MFVCMWWFFRQIHRKESGQECLKTNNDSWPLEVVQMAEGCHRACVWRVSRALCVFTGRSSFSEPILINWGPEGSDHTCPRPLAEERERVSFNCSVPGSSHMSPGLSEPRSGHGLLSVLLFIGKHIVLMFGSPLEFQLDCPHHR